MNWLLIGVLVLLLVMTVIGHKKGLIRKLVGIIGWIVTMVLVYMALPSIAEFLKEHTVLHSAIQNSLTNSDVELMQMLRIIGLEDMAGGIVADKVLRLIAFVVTFVLVSIVVHGVAWALHIASRLPVLKGTNQLLGAIIGFVEGLFLIWIAFLIIGASSTSAWGLQALYMIADNGFLTWLFSHNPLMLLLSA